MRTFDFGDFFWRACCNDLTTAAAAFWNMGENCTANSRIIVPRKRKDAFTEALLAELENWRIGDPLDPENNLGSIVSEGQFRTIMGYIEKGKAEGGHVLTRT